MVKAMDTDKAYAAVSAFMKKHRMHPSDIDLDRVCSDFESEMVKGLSSYKSGSSLQMLPTFINMSDDIPREKPVIVIDAGGTNFRTALVRFDRDLNCVISDFHNHPMPGAKGITISKDEFFDTIYSYIEPLLGQSDQIGFCFSYATAIMPNRDGKVIELSKEVRVDGLIGEPVNKNLLDRIRKYRGSADYSIVQLNDTVATLLGGKASYPGRTFDGYIGLILGTGTNTCYIERCENIKKLAEVEMTPEQRAAYGPGNLMLINNESGCFAKAPFGDMDESFDRQTKDPGRYLFEKAMSGGYQGPLTAEVLRAAAREGLFSKAANERFLALKDLESRDIDTFLFYPYGDNALAACCKSPARAGGEAGGACGADEEDARKLYFIIDTLFDRIAAFTAANVTAIIRHTGSGKNPNRPVCVTADGTTFYKSKMLRPKLDHYIREFTSRENGIYCDFVKAENGVLAGTAIAALQNP